MNILLTGGAGYIGSHVVYNLIDNGHNVYVIDNLSTGTYNLIPNSIKSTICDIADTAKIETILKNNKFDLLMHFAAFIKVDESVNFPEKYFLNNTDKTISLFEICKKFELKNIIFSSTAAVYGEAGDRGLISESCVPKPANPYASSKLKVENYLKKNKDVFNFIILRYFNVAGADPLLRTGQISKQSTHLIKVLSEVVTGKKNSLEIYGNDYKTHDGTAIRDYIHVSDLAEIHVEMSKYLLNEKKSNILNCGYGRGFSVMEVLNAFKKISEINIKYTFESRRDGDVESLIADTTKIHKYIKWKPKFDKLDTIIETSLEWEKKLNEKNF